MSSSSAWETMGHFNREPNHFTYIDNAQYHQMF